MVRALDVPPISAAVSSMPPSGRSISSRSPRPAISTPMPRMVNFPGTSGLSDNVPWAAMLCVPLTSVNPLEKVTRPLAS